MILNLDIQFVLYPDEQLEAIANRLGFGEQFNQVIESNQYIWQLLNEKKIDYDDRSNDNDVNY